jgi:predicted RNA methylase
VLAVSILPVRSHLETSLALIERAGANPSSTIIDVGAGESTFADDLLALGFQNITVLDISETAINACKKRMGAAVDLVRWLVADVTLAKLEQGEKRSRC